MRRLATLIAALAILAGCSAPKDKPRVHPRPTPAHVLIRLTPLPRGAHPLPKVGGLERVSVVCAAADCGPYGLMVRWSGLPFAFTPTGYYITVGGVQLADTTSPYPVVGMDCAATYVIGIQAHDGAGHTSSVYSTSYTTPPCAGGSAPVSTVEPVVSGTVATGSVLSTTNGAWSGSPTSYAYQWQDCATDGTACSNIVGATSSTYTVVSGDAGHTIEALVTATNSHGSTSSSAPIVPLVDEFSGTSIDQNVWHVMNQQGDTSGDEQECYQPGQASESGGFLTETAAFVSGGFTCASGTPPFSSCTGACATVASGGTAHYKSAALEEISTAFTFGTVVARIKFGGVAGNDSSPWGAIWLLGAACQGPTSWLTGTQTSGDTGTGAFYCPWSADSQDAAEIDIGEDNTQGSTSIRENVINSSGTNSNCTSGTISDIHSNYHTYELDWTASSITFKIDGITQTACTVSSGVPTHPMFLIMQLALQPSPTSTDFPFSNSVDYIRVSH